MAKKLIRLKPYDPKRQNVLQRYIYKGIRFEPGKWYEVSEKIADYLADAKQRDEDPYSPAAFDVALTVAEAKEIERKEREIIEAQNRRALGLTVQRARGDAEARVVNLDAEEEAQAKASEEADGVLTSEDVSAEPEPEPEQKPKPRKPSGKKPTSKKTKRSRR